MSLITFDPEVAKAIHAMVFERYIKPTGMTFDRYELRFDPQLVNELKVEPDYNRAKIVITTRYLPIGQMADRFHAQMNSFSKHILPSFVFGDGVFKYNDKLFRLEIDRWSGSKNLDKSARFHVTNLVGVKVQDVETGAVVIYVEEGSSLFGVRDKVIDKMYREGK